MTQLRIAIISDMHCHDLVHENEKQESYLMAGGPRNPVVCHPVAALQKILKENRIKSDIVVSPGDLSNKISQAGLTQSWDHLNEIKRALKASLLVVTLGNHDVDSHKTTNHGPFEVPRAISANFPFNSVKESNSYWSNGYAIVKRKNRFIVLIINSVLDHTNVDSAKRGSFDSTRLSNLEESLARIRALDNYPYRIAILHHHPILHTIEDMRPDDVLAGGDQLIKLLSDHGFIFVIHGHKHFPRILRHQSMFILASGSFSAFFKRLGSRTRNLFHILELSKHDDNPIIGELRSWEFNYGLGWNPTSTKSSGFPSIIKLSQQLREINSGEIINSLRRKKTRRMTRDKLFSEFPSLEFCLPNELEVIHKTLARDGCKIGYDDDGLILEIAMV